MHSKHFNGVWSQISKVNLMLTGGNPSQMKDMFIHFQIIAVCRKIITVVAVI